LFSCDDALEFSLYRVKKAAGSTDKAPGLREKFVISRQGLVTVLVQLRHTRARLPLQSFVVLS
jgi:hypothetical protein